MFDVKEKVAIVTGGASGIGLGAVEALLKKGAKVVIADYNGDAVDAQVARLKETYGNYVLGVKVDVSNEECVKNMVDETVKAFGRVDALVNSAGVAGRCTIEDEDVVADVKRAMDVNVNGGFYCAKYAVAEMVKHGEGGAIVNVASIMGIVGTANGSAYNGSKHAVVGMTKAWALDLAPKNIRVNVLCPGYTDSGMCNTNTLGAFYDYAKSMHPLAAGLDRIANAEEMGHAVMFMIENTYLTGQAIIVDGGYTTK